MSEKTWQAVLTEALGYARTLDKLDSNEASELDLALSERDLRHAILEWTHARASAPTTAAPSKRDERRCKTKTLHDIGLCGCYGS